MTSERAGSRRRLPFWVGPAVMVVLAVGGLGVALLFSKEPTPPCTPLEDAIGRKSFKAPPCRVIEVTHAYVATLETSVGRIRIAMEPRLAPKSVNNFVFLARAGFYDNITFHRVENEEDHAFVQTGDPTGTGRGDAGYTFKESATPGTEYVRGIVAMAGNARAAGVNGSQFFIIVRDWKDLRGKSGLPTETFFGVIEPFDEESFATLDRMIAVPLDGTRPKTPIVLRRVTVVDTGESDG